MYSPASYFCDRLVAPLDLADERRRSTSGNLEMADEWFVRRRHLPHVEVDGKGYFVTGVLQDAMQARELSAIRDFERQLDRRQRRPSMSEQEWHCHKQKLLFAFIDRLLDSSPYATHLRNPEAASIVCDAFRYFAEDRYDLWAFVVMPSHHHWYFTPREAWASRQPTHDRRGVRRTPREVICHSIQSYTANHCNRLLGRSGSFWLGETYDHFVRDEAEALRIIRYIENNPVKAGFVESPQNWQYSSAYVRQQLDLTIQDAIPQ